jgi:hypothetical protein
MANSPDPIDVRRYDEVVKLLVHEPDLSFEEVASRVKVSPSTVRKIWEGSISRAPAIVIERLATPRRCPECGTLCRDWPCILCEMQRRREGRSATDAELRFVYKRGNN